MRVIIDPQLIYGILFLKILLTIIFALFTARIDEAHIKKGEFITNKAPRFVQRFAPLALASIGFLNIGWLFLGLSLLFWVVFNPFLNYLRKLPFWYVGDKGIDKWLKNNLLMHKLIYFACFPAIGFCLYMATFLMV